MALFQSTRPRGARHGGCIPGDPRAEFQSTRPRGARPRLRSRPTGQRRCFNPRARAGRDPQPGEELSDEVLVSIHAPARGATITPSGAKIFEFVSIHAPARGATFMLFSPFSPSPCFNPRARAGRDRKDCGIQTRSLRVSIHAPARGATARTAVSSSFPPRFNPRARAGRDKDGCIKRYCDDQFQSTRPCGARRVTTLVEGTEFVVSIHAPARGATVPSAVTLSTTTCFNPRARAGRDVYQLG